jgi:hypothetical protein
MGHVAAPELTSLGRQGPELRDNYSHYKFFAGIHFEEDPSKRRKKH